MELRLEAVTKRYPPEGGRRRGQAPSAGSPAALDAVTVAFPSGQTTALLGPSGSGKSTVLRMLVGLVTPDAGVVEVDGGPLGARPLEPYRRRVGYVIQDGGLFPHLTAAENVTLMARHLRWPREHIAKRLDELVALTRFPGDALARRPRALSGGQAQRVAIMRALFLDPEVLLMDEPLGALDPLVRAELRDDLRAIFQRLSKTVVIVTHDVAEAERLSDWVVLMRDGKVIQQGPFAELARRPADPFVTAFLKTELA